MEQQDFELKENANFVFQFENEVYKLCVNINNGIIILEKLRKYQKKRHILKTILLSQETPTKETVIENPEKVEVEEQKYLETTEEK